MADRLQTAQKLLAARPMLAGFEVHRHGDEIHLVKQGESFVRLLPVAENGWRMEYFHNLERWEIIDFTGPLEACLDFLIDSPHYLFWTG